MPVIRLSLFRAFSYDEMVARDKASLDIFWLRDESLGDTGNLPAPELIAAEIVEDLQAALEQFAAIAASLAPAEGAPAGRSGRAALPGLLPARDGLGAVDVGEVTPGGQPALGRHRLGT